MDTLGVPVVLHLPRAVQPIGRTLTRQTVTIGHTTTDKLGDMEMNNTIHGAIHIKTHGKLTHGMMELMLVIGTLLQAPDLDGMQQEVGASMIEINQIKEITQQRVLHNKTSI